MQIETILSALSDPTRLRIMRLLEHMELAVGELAQALGQSQPRVSRHVAILCDSGLTERRREGSWVFLRKNISKYSDEPLEAAVAELLDAAEANDEQFSAQCAEDRHRLTAIRSRRETKAAEFFASHAETWDQLRALLSPAEEVEAAMLDQLGDAPLGRLLDIGTGTGRIASILAGQSDYVVGFDRSPEMLRLARARLQDLPAHRWELVQGDFNAMPFAGEGFDTLILHQVLHYAQDPAYVLQEVSRVARPGARLMIVDLAAHGREELRELHAHVRLGFTDEQIGAYLAESGFSAPSRVGLAGQGLTTVIWSARRPG